ncbi:restriction endonuclease subunit S [Campylobacter upsaliensis]
MSEVCEVSSGGTPNKNKTEYWSNGTINWVKSEVCQNCYVYENQVKEKITELGLQKSSAKLLNKNSTLIALVGATIGKAGFLTFKSATNQNVASLYPKDEKKLNPKFLYFASLELYLEFEKLKGFAMANLGFIRNLKIPLPPLAVQNEIVELLDKFDTLTNDLTSGIPAEIEARKKQYEYYRERLLSFIAKD